MDIKSMSLSRWLSLGLLLLIIAIKFDWPIGIRFEDPFYNYAYVGCATVLMVVVIGHLANLPSLLQKVLYLIIMLVLTFPLTYCSVYEVKSIKRDGRDLSFEKWDEVTQDGYIYRLYRTNGGATTAFGMVVRREQPLILGLKAVKVIYTEYEAADAKLEISNDGLILLHIEEYGKEKPAHTVTINNNA